ncbi:MAG TPA: thioesterase family protein, partial [Sunxiuqinia sp.]|nr:thioesterase family protein [Sunxiuqinia sp.]
NHIMLPVISMNLKYHRPAGYDEQLSVRTAISEIPKTRFTFHFEFRNAEGDLVCTASSTVVFVNSKTRKPMKVPQLVVDAMEEYSTISSILK